MYIHERDNWTNFRWDESQVSLLQEVVCRKQGMLYGRLSSLGFDSKSKDTAIRDIQDLLDKNILVEDIPGAKRPSYSIVYDAEDLTQFFTDVNIIEENGVHYLKALFKGKKPVSERILKLDAERFQKGNLPLSNLLNKYCSYIVASN